MIVHMIGNAHIDPVWLWPWQAGVDEVLATFRSAVDRCREYPEFVFTRGEAWCYRVVERLDPELFEDVNRLVATGQIHVTGGQWIQPDVNLPTYEGLRRQIIHGRRYFKEKFGVTPDVGYNVDSFGHPATLPDLLADHGYLGYVFHRPSQQQTAVPAATFRWRGPRGGEVIGFRIPAPYTTRTDDLYGQIMLSLDAADAALGHVMCFYGVGNHGGGPTKGNIEYILNNRHAFAGAELRFSTPAAFFRAAAERREALPVVEHELQGVFPGCYTVMQSVKQEQRRGEHLLTQAEAAIGHFGDDAEKADLTAKLDLAWEDLLFTEFHDILAGTSIERAWPSVHALHGRARIAGEEIVTHVTRRFARTTLPKENHQQIVVINPGPADFDGLIEHEPFLDFDAFGDRRLIDAEGRPVPLQFVQPQSTIMLTPAIVFPAKVRAGEVAVFTLRDTDKDESDAAAEAADSSSSMRSTDQESAAHAAASGARGVSRTPGGIVATPSGLLSDRVRVDLSATGVRQITIDDRLLLGGDGLTLRLQEDAADTWGFHINGFTGPFTDTLAGCEWVVEESGPLRSRVRAETVIGRSPVRLTLTLHVDRPAVGVEIDVTFAERFRLLRLTLPLATAAADWRAGLAGGWRTRKTSSVEWPVHGWAAAGDIGVVSHDANGVTVDEHAMHWSLLRATRMAWSGAEGTVHVGRDAFTDQGVHRLYFEIGPAQSDEAMDAAANRIATSPVVFDQYEGMNRPPWGNHPPRRLWTPAEHRARLDGRMTDLPDDGGAAVEERG